MAENVGSIFYTVDLDTSKMLQSERDVSRRLDRIGNEGDRLKNRFTAVATAISAALSAIAIEGLVSKVVQAQRQFDVLFSGLRTVTGGVDQASDAWARLVEFASKTPYTLDQSVQGFVKLKALGLDPSERAMRSFGNTASAMGKDLTQMIEAVADASTGEFERLKEFGIKASTQGDQVSFVFQGVTTTVRNSAEEITEYLTKIGEVNFAGAMETRMATLDGAMSNLEDSWNSLYLAIAQSGFGDMVQDMVRGATEAIQELALSIESGGLTEYFDTLSGIIKAGEVVVVSLAGAMTAKLIAAMAGVVTQAYATATAVSAASVAVRTFSGVVAALGGPVGIAITALGLLVLNWDKVGNSAKSAADISEDSARRIAAALNKSEKAASVDLARQLKEAEEGLQKAQEARGRTAATIYKKEAKAADLAVIDERIDAYRKSIADIKAAMGQASAKGGGAGWGRGSINPALAIPPEVQPEAKTEKPTTPKPKPVTMRAPGTPSERPFDGSSLQAEADRFNADQQQAIGYAAGIINEQADPAEQIRLRFEARKTVLDEMLAQELVTEQLHAQAVTANQQSMTEELMRLDEQRKASKMAADQAMLQGSAQAFGSLADLAKTFAGEQSGIFKAMFAASKAFAIAESIIKIQQGIASAAALPFPANIPAMASVAAATSGIVSTIAGTNYGGGRQYGGAVNAGSMYRINETGKSEMFVGSNGSQYMIPAKNGRIVAANDIGGGGGAYYGGDSIQVTTNVMVSNEGASSSTSTSGDGDAQTARQLGDMVTAATKEVMVRELRPGGLLWQLKQGQV